MIKDNLAKLPDPLALAGQLWPDIGFYKQQREIIYSVWNNVETIVPAGNMLGKDFVAGRIVILFFLTRTPCRIVTTSAKDDHLRVLWGEILQGIRESVVPLVAPYGPLVPTHHQLKKLYNGQECPISYVRGMVASQDTIASMQGHHVSTPRGWMEWLRRNRMQDMPRTLFVADEASSVVDEYFRMARTWAKRMLILGNTWPCENYFKRAIEGNPATNDSGGDIPLMDYEIPA